MSDCITWKEGDIEWDATDFTWSEICLLIEIVTQGGGYSEQFRRLHKKDKGTQKTFIKLLCKIKGEEDYWKSPNSVYLLIKVNKCIHYIQTKIISSNATSN